MSVCCTRASESPKSERSSGTRNIPGKPRNVRRSSSRSSPASRLDSPSRSRNRVSTCLDPKVGKKVPATSMLAPRVLFSTTRSRMISFS